MSMEEMEWVKRRQLFKERGRFGAKLTILLDWRWCVCAVSGVPGRGARTLEGPLQQPTGTWWVLGRYNLFRLVVQWSHLVGVQECKGVSLMWKKNGDEEVFCCCCWLTLTQSKNRSYREPGQWIKFKSKYFRHKEKGNGDCWHGLGFWIKEES